MKSLNLNAIRVEISGKDLSVGSDDDDFLVARVRRVSLEKNDCGFSYSLTLHYKNLNSHSTKLKSKIKE